jgi:RNA polymerase sigma factor (sigma-70 family)
MDEPGEDGTDKPGRRPGGRAAASRSRRAAPTGRAGRRPAAADLFAAVVELVSSGAPAFRSTARRYSLCAADADDAYQRGLEILMTKAPTASRSELRPWLHTVIKHEALALRRQRERLLAGAPGSPAETIAAESAPGPDEGAVERERVRQTAEALADLKPGEIQCLLLKALGYSYEEISARTGFSWTKVNRSLTEGRKRFFSRFGQIESGERCERFAPLLSAASDGEASADDERRLKAHLRGCHACRAALRAYRTVPLRLAQLLPPAVLAPSADDGGWWSRLYESLVAGTGDRAAALGYKLQHAGEMVASQKTAAVVASTAALAGGAAVHERAFDQRQAEKRPKAGKGTSSPAPQRAAAPVHQLPPATSVPRRSSGSTPGPTAREPTAEDSAATEFGPQGVPVRRRSPSASSDRLGSEPVRSASNTSEAPGIPGSAPSPAGTSPSRDGGAAEFGP